MHRIAVQQHRAVFCLENRREGDFHAVLFAKEIRPAEYGRDRPSELIHSRAPRLNGIFVLGQVIFCPLQNLAIVCVDVAVDRLSKVNAQFLRLIDFSLVPVEQVLEFISVYRLVYEKCLYMGDGFIDIGFQRCRIHVNTERSPDIELQILIFNVLDVLQKTTNLLLVLTDGEAVAVNIKTEFQGKALVGNRLNLRRKLFNEVVDFRFDTADSAFVDFLTAEPAVLCDILHTEGIHKVVNDLLGVLAQRSIMAVAFSDQLELVGNILVSGRKLALDIRVFHGCRFCLVNSELECVFVLELSILKVDSGDNFAIPALDISGNFVNIIIPEPTRLPISMLVEILFQLSLDIVNAERPHDLPGHEFAALHIVGNISVIDIEQPPNRIAESCICCEHIAVHEV